MPTIESLEMLLVNELHDLLDAENRITKALPKMIKAAESEQLQNALANHLSETGEQIERLEDVLGMLEAPARAKPCHGMRGILEEGSEHMSEDYSAGSLCDAAIIGAAQKVEHYEISAYGTATAYAKMLGYEEVAQMLARTLEEEKAADQLLTSIAETIVNPEAMSGSDVDNEEAGDANGPGRSRSSSGSKSRGTASRSRSPVPARSKRSTSRR